VYKQIEDLLGKPRVPIEDLLGNATVDERRGKGQAKAVPAVTSPVSRLPSNEPDPYATLYTPVHKALLAGLIDHIGNKLPEKPEY
jgi:hypothetical protein